MSNIEAGKFSHRRSIRKTLIIDGDVAEAIEDRLKTTNLKEKIIVNDLLRKGLMVVKEEKSRKPFELVTFPSGLQEGVTSEQIEKLLDEI